MRQLKQKLSGSMLTYLICMLHHIAMPCSYNISAMPISQSILNWILLKLQKEEKWVGTYYDPKHPTSVKCEFGHVYISFRGPSPCKPVFRGEFYLGVLYYIPSPFFSPPADSSSIRNSLILPNQLLSFESCNFHLYRINYIRLLILG